MQTLRTLSDRTRLLHTRFLCKGQTSLITLASGPASGRQDDAKVTSELRRQFKGQVYAADNVSKQL